ncbi:MAG: CPBP family intramembrane glutamic endopeptidase, partial [Pirellulales bacterium]
HNRLPGAHPTTVAAVAVAVGVSLLLLGLETWTEIRLGVSEQQSDMTVLFGLYTLAAAFIEELIFRGFIYYDKGGKALLVLSCLAASILFALIHPYMWQWNGDADWMNKLTFNFSTIAVISTSFVFIKSLWYYTVRFYPLNPRHSLIPCIAAHFATNVGVFVVKAVQGHVVGLY